jgi:hypothetical protein
MVAQANTEPDKDQEDDQSAGLFARPIKRSQPNKQRV